MVPPTLLFVASTFFAQVCVYNFVGAVDLAYVLCIYISESMVSTHSLQILQAFPWNSSTPPEFLEKAVFGAPINLREVPVSNLLRDSPVHLQIALQTSSRGSLNDEIAGTGRYFMDCLEKATSCVDGSRKQHRHQLVHLFTREILAASSCIESVD